MTRFDAGSFFDERFAVSIYIGVMTIRISRLVNAFYHKTLMYLDNSPLIKVEVKNDE
jgi:hypothetical protein